jgi:Ca-activated chloride channel family protein
MTSIDALPLLDDKRALAAGADRCCGCMIVTREARRFSLPLRAVSFAARVAERVAEVTVEQTFENTYAELLEAVYIFPLSGSAAVSRFELHVNGKQLVGIVEERAEARRQYAQAIAQGKKAALLEQERDDVFTVKVGNLPPRSVATVKMVYSERLPAFDDGETELRIPLVVAPRYIPGQPLERESLGDGTESDTTGVPDASRISPPRLAPGLRGDVKLDIKVDLLGAEGVDELGCTQHAVKLAASAGTLSVALASKDELLDRDFVLRWRTAAKEEKPVLLVTKKGGECYGLLSLVPPRDVQEGQGARDVIFLLDRSGSMEGAKMDSARKAIERLLDTLQPHDRVAVCAFDDVLEWYQDGFATADAMGQQKIKRWLRSIGPRNGTELDAALRGVLQLFESSTNVLAPGGMKKIKPAAPRMPVLVLVTDGQVGNESEILRRIENRLARVRVFTLGIDSAVNAAFLRRLAQLGRGTATLCSPGADLEDALARIGREIGTPVLLDVEVEDRGLGYDEASLTPERLPDLFAGRTASVFFKCRSLKGAVKIRALRAEGGVFEQVVNAEVVDLNALPQLWAKSRIADLEDRYRLAYGGAGGGLEASRHEILGLALEHQLLTRFTAFIVVDHSEVAERLAKRKIVQAVEQPAEWLAGKAEGAKKRKLDSDSHAAMPAFSVSPRAIPPTSRPGSFGAPASPPPPSSAEAFADPFAVDDLEGAEPFARAPQDPPARLGGALRGGSARGARYKGDEASGSGPIDEDELLLDESGEADAESAEEASGERLDDLDVLLGDGDETPPAAKRPAPPSPVSKATPRKEPPAPKQPGTGRMAPLPPPPRPLEKVLDELGKELARVLLELEAGRWADTTALDKLREEALLGLALRGLEPRAKRTSALLSRTLVELVTALRKKGGKPADLAHPVRAASEALAAQCRSELAPLLGSGGSPWEATV